MEKTYDIDSQIQAALPSTTAFRHELHKHPELTWQEKHTAKTIADALAQIPGLAVTTGIGRFGIIADLKGGEAGPMLALRADMDALPVIEKTKGIDYISENHGVMHACGHDGHCANLLGAAKVLSALRGNIKGTIRFIFQPAEEGGAGAREMIKDGALDGVDVIYGLHGWPELPEGQIYVRKGPMMAGNAEIKISLHGKGGHGAFPHLSTDQLLAGCRVVEQLGTIRNRMINPAEPFVLSITTFHGGTAINVIADRVDLGGTIRYLDQKTGDFAAEKVKQICHAVAKSMDLIAEVSVIPGYPPVVNDAAATGFLEETASRAIGRDQVLQSPHPTMGSEDFSFYLEKTPGSYFFLGMDDGRSGGYPSLHHPEYNFNDSSLKTGMKVFANLALSFGHQEKKSR